MESEEDNKAKGESKEKDFQIFKHFLTCVAKFDELVAVGGRLLTGFQQGLEVHTCMLGLRDHLVKAKSLLNDLDSFLEDARAALENASDHLSPLLDNESVDELDLQESNNEDETTSSHLREPEVTDYAALMAIIYSMVKQDYVIQDKIVTSLNFKSSAGELESYFLMWSFATLHK